MGKAIINHFLASGNEVEEAIRDGWYLKKPDGKLAITQKALAAYLAAQDKMEKLHSLIKLALEKDGAVLGGEFDAALFEEMRKSPNWREEFIRLGGDPKAVLDATPKKPYTMVRVFKAGEKQDGTRKTPEAITPEPPPAPTPADVPPVVL